MFIVISLSYIYTFIAVASVKGVEGITWSGGRGLLSKLVRPEQQGNPYKE